MLLSVKGRASMSESKQSKPIGFFRDNLGDYSSKRLTAMILLAFAMCIGTAGVVLLACGKDVTPLVKYIFVISLGGCLVAQGLTLPEVFAHK